MDRLEEKLKICKQKEEQLDVLLAVNNLPSAAERDKDASVDRTPLESAELQSKTETAQMLEPFDMEIPPSGKA